MRGLTYGDFLTYLPWQEGEISQETMNWTIATPVPDAPVVGETPTTDEGAEGAEASPQTSP